MEVNQQERVRKANAKATNNCHYHYDDVLGKGAFGVVLKAHDTQRGVVVAVKIIKSKKSLVEFVSLKMPTSGERGRKEVEILLNLQHDNVVAIRDHFESVSYTHLTLPTIYSV